MVSIKWDWNTALEVAAEEAREEGIEKGIEKTAIAMLRDKMPIGKIRKLTQLSLERIAELGKAHHLL